jgi:thiamine-phosphate pyrophosphorylase
MQNHEQLAAAIVTAHTNLALPVQAAGPVEFSSQAPAYRGAKQACQMLGFIASDAQCVAIAWQRMTERTGQFNPRLWPDDPADFGLQPWPRAEAFAPCPQALGLYAVMPDAAWVGRMARAGVPTVQLRFKSDSPSAIKREVSAAVQAVKGTETLLFINDHWQAAIEAGAYGVHLGQEDMEGVDWQTIRAAGLRLGLSTHGYAEMLRADQFSPSYIAMGAVFATTLKRMVTAPQGVSRLHAYAHLMWNYPLVAIGGIDASALPEVLVSGVGSVAMVRALLTAKNPEHMALELQATIRAITRT